MDVSSSTITVLGLLTVLVLVVGLVVWRVVRSRESPSQGRRERRMGGLRSPDAETTGALDVDRDHFDPHRDEDLVEAVFVEDGAPVSEEAEALLLDEGEPETAAAEPEPELAAITPALDADEDSEPAADVGFGEATIRAYVTPPPDVPAIPVHFATDREIASEATATFSGRRGDGQLRYGRALVTLPPAHRPGLIERPRRILGIFREREDPNKHVMIVERTLLDEGDFLSGLREALSAADESEALLFIHGFNVEFDDALRRTAQLSYDLNFGGPSLLYSWPSRGRVTDYIADGSSVEWTVFHLRDFLEQVLVDVGARAVHVIAHSMGNRALVAAIRALDFAELERRGAAKLRQVVFTAPDIDAATFRDLARTFERGAQAERFTLYASSRDKALEAAQKLNHYPRAGDSGDGLVVVDSVDTIDASEVETDFLGHSYYGEAKSVISDLYYLIGEGMPPDRRAFLRPAEHPDGQYWRFRL